MSLETSKSYELEAKKLRLREYLLRLSLNNHKYWNKDFAAYRRVYGLPTALRVLM